jgi:hypothetical protein
MKPWVLAAAAAVAACQAPAPAGPAGSWSMLPAGAARLTLSLADLPGEARHARFRSADGRYVEETAQWGDGGTASAGLRLSEASPGPPLTDPDGPVAIIRSWTALLDKRPAFAEAGASQNAQGPVSWWRAGLGTRVCVLFLQRPASQQPIAATLSGYYCNPSGTPLSAQAAATVVERIGLRPRQEGQ